MAPGGCSGQGAFVPFRTVRRLPVRSGTCPRSIDRRRSLLVCGHHVVDRSETRFRRDRLTWVAYLMLAWFAYLQAAPGLVIVHLRGELDLSYSAGGLHVAAFAAGSLVAGVISARLERASGGARCSGRPPR